MQNEDVHEEQSRLQQLRDLLTEGISSGAPQVWELNTFLQRMKEKHQNKG